MNEQIQKLAEQAGIDFGNFESVTIDIDNAEKFAELIIQECADWIDRQDESRCPYGIDLLEHFGVK